MAQLLAVLLPPIPPGNTIHVKALLEGTQDKLTRQALACLSHRKVIHPGERNETDYNRKNLVTEQ
jgi:hypothetical protein